MTVEIQLINPLKILSIFMRLRGQDVYRLEKYDPLIQIKLYKDQLRVELFYKKNTIEFLVKKDRNDFCVSLFEFTSLDNIKSGYRI